MLPKPAVITRLIRSNVSFLLYGQKASGKTTTILNLLEESRANYVVINCTLANKRSNFLRLLSVELYKYLKEKMDYGEKLRDLTNLDSWISEMKKLIMGNKEVVDYLDNLIIFMDNIEEMVMN